ncbi:MAG: right-handed parallel beta-helix repeat-containing protein [Actinomycetota bacterium]|nr:right-handed parallel beta-helix repeat-containing protein [Actinomycetota bacterium]
MRKHKLTSLLAATAAFVTVGASSAAANTLYVNTNGHDGTGCTKLAPCPTIGAAVAQAATGDIVTVESGTYRESITVAKDIKLIGVGATTTVIDASGQTNGILITGSGASGATVGGFTVEHAVQEGILALSTSRVTIADNMVLFNDTGSFAANPTGTCLPDGNVPGDCGEGVHLEAVNHATVSGNLVKHDTGGILLTDEVGPTYANLVSDNTVVNNPSACGITLVGHSGSAYTATGPTPSTGGVYDNRVLNNTVNGNGTKSLGGGILLASGMAGAGVYSNLIKGNVANNNGLGGLTIHAHLTGQDFNGNQIIGNSFSHDGLHGYPSGAPGDTDAGIRHTVGIIVYSLVTRLQGTVIRGNRLSREFFGIWTDNAPSIKQSANTFTKSVRVDVSQR